MSDTEPQVTSRRGPQGIPGPRGQRGMTWPQALAMFVLVVAIMLTLSWRSEIQARQIRENTAAIVQSNHERCLGGVIIIRHFNQQQDALIAIESRLAKSPMVTPAGREAARARVRAYQSARVQPLPNCPS